MKKPIDIKLFSNLDIWKVEADQDRYLKDYFVETPAYKELTSTKKYIVVGRKGTGKTALKEIFYERYKDQKHYVLSDTKFQDIFNTHFFDELTTNYSDHNKTYRELVKFVLLVRMMFMILEDHSIDADFRHEVNQFLSLNGYKLNSLGELFGRVKENNNIKINSEISFKLNLGFGSVGGKIEQKRDNEKETFEIDYKNLVSDLKDIIFSKLKKDKHYIILMDKLDEFWTTYFNYYDNVVLNLINTVKDINHDLNKYLGPDNQSRIILFIREDMLNKVRGKDGNLNKIIQDDTIKIDWQSDYESETGSLLNDLVNKRIEKGLELVGLDATEYEKPFIFNVLNNNEAFRKVRQEMYERKHVPLIEQTTNKTIKKLLYNRTYLRPRDILKYFHFLSIGNDKFSFQNAYSDYLWEELNNELYPVLHDPVRTSKTLKKICLGKTGKFEVADFAEIYKQIDSSENMMDANIDRTIKETLAKLYEYSVIGNYKTDYTIRNTPFGEEKIPRNYVVFKYREMNRTDFNLDEKCIIHAGLYHALGIQPSNI